MPEPTGPLAVATAAQILGLVEGSAETSAASAGLQDRIARLVEATLSIERGRAAAELPARLKTAAEAKRDGLATRLDAARARDAREVARAADEKRPLADHYWQDRHRIEQQLRAAAAMAEALDGVAGETE
ncbi:hypothetical protein NPA31_007385 [Aurantimonas sp. MSK8Z-1]|uniref:hypothetical protein n=1 Tax=Mangrovibrevibacter kandeliae TaxID=2968473 RepID=UPI0021185C79|nr:hypothetical protein [Aurantimonas sp. MSK8Z-1]MCW4114784.1 hypothetical protein [Aurantimonas sp. MSK8Z-1]